MTDAPDFHALLAAQRAREQAETAEAVSAALLTPWTVLTPTQAARRLPMAKGAALAWLASSGLVHDLEGRKVVIWGDVIAFIRDPDGRAFLEHAGIAGRD